MAAQHFVVVAMVTTTRTVVTISSFFQIKVALVTGGNDGDNQDISGDDIALLLK